MIVIVAGMHRSGTSALAGMLHHNGIVMGREKEFYPPPMKENKKGFFENVRFRRVNDRILAEHGYRVKSFYPLVPVVKSCSLDMRLRAEQLIEEYDTEFTAWGWKDPRTCLTMGVWLGTLRQMDKDRDLRLLVPCRSTRDIAASMARRGNKGTSQHFEDLARMYNKRLMLAAGDHDVSFKTVDFVRLIHKTEDVAKELTEFLDWPVTDTTFIDPSITTIKVA